MNSEVEQYLGMAICCVIFLALSYYYKKKPPKKINALYGFRRRRTITNQDVWEVSNRRNAQDLWHFALVLTSFAFFLWIFKISHAMLLFMGGLLVGLALALLSTLRYLDTIFDKNGNRK